MALSSGLVLPIEAGDERRQGRGRHEQVELVVISLEVTPNRQALLDATTGGARFPSVMAELSG